MDGLNLAYIAAAMALGRQPDAGRCLPRPLPGRVNRVARQCPAAPARPSRHAHIPTSQSLPRRKMQTYAATSLVAQFEKGIPSALSQSPGMDVFALWRPQSLPIGQSRGPPRPRQLWLAILRVVAHD